MSDKSETKWTPSKEEPCPVCGTHAVITNINITLLPAYAGQWGYCSMCGVALPGPTAAGHQCTPRST